jgi:hypothetical protein
MHTEPEQVFAEIEKSRNHYMGRDSNNRIRWIESMMAMDAANPSVVKAEMFIVAVKNDHTATPGSALGFAKKLGVKPFILDSSYGHNVHACPDNNMGQLILRFSNP